MTPPSDPSNKIAEEIKVVDRRRFTAEGDTKIEGEPVAVTATISAATASAATTSAASASAAAATVAAATVKADSATTDGYLRQSGGPDFSSFVISMATQSLMLLGEIPDPVTHEQIFDLQAARQTIDMLSIIEEKTRGNLSPDEARLMGEILASLRLAYVKRAREKNA